MSKSAEEVFDKQVKEAIQHSRQQTNKPGKSSQCSNIIEIQKKKEGDVKYTYSYCKAIGHNSRSCKLKNR